MTQNDTSKYETVEEYNIKSALATQAGIFEAGKQTLLKNQKIKEKQENRHTVNLFLSNTKWKNNKKAKVFKKYVKFTEEDIEMLKKEIVRLNEDYDTLNEMSDEYIVEIDDLQTEMDKDKRLNEVLINKLNIQLNALLTLCVVLFLCNVFYNIFGVSVFNRCIYTSLNTIGDAIIAAIIITIYTPINWIFKCFV
jgi:hypothetical protein